VVVQVVLGSENPMDSGDIDMLVGGLIWFNGSKCALIWINGE